MEDQPKVQKQPESEDDQQRKQSQTVNTADLSIFLEGPNLNKDQTQTQKVDQYLDFTSGSKKEMRKQSTIAFDLPLTGRPRTRRESIQLVRNYLNLHVISPKLISNFKNKQQNNPDSTNNFQQFYHQYQMNQGQMNQEYQQQRKKAQRRTQQQQPQQYRRRRRRRKKTVNPTDDLNMFSQKANDFQEEAVDDFFKDIQVDDYRYPRTRRNTRQYIQDRKQSILQAKPIFQLSDTRKTSIDGINWNEIGKVLKSERIQQIEPDLFQDQFKKARRKLSELKPLEFCPPSSSPGNPLNSMKISLKLDEHGQNQIFLSNQNQRNKYQLLVNKNYEIKQICDVCLEKMDDQKDKLVFCDLCRFCVHQSCYQSDLQQAIPKQWFCQKCWYLIYNDLEPTSICCYFCPELKGIMKKIKNANNIWVLPIHFYILNIFQAHVACVNWIPEIYYDRKKENVNNLENLIQERKKLLCTYCKIIHGHCIQCDYNSCGMNFHVRCAQQHGLIRQQQAMEKLQNKSNYLPVYCEKHLKQLDPQQNKLAISIQEKYLKNTNLWSQKLTVKPSTQFQQLPYKKRNKGMNKNEMAYLFEKGLKNLELSCKNVLQDSLKKLLTFYREYTNLQGNELLKMNLYESLMVKHYNFKKDILDLNKSQINQINQIKSIEEQISPNMQSESPAKIRTQTLLKVPSLIKILIQQKKLRRNSCAVPKILLEPAIEKKIKYLKIDKKVMNDILNFKQKQILRTQQNQMQSNLGLGGIGKKRTPRKYKKRPRSNQAFNLYTIKPRIEIMKKIQTEELKAFQMKNSQSNIIS